MEPITTWLARARSQPSEGFPQISLATAKCEIGKNMVVNGETESEDWLGTGMSAGSNDTWHVTLACAIQREDD